MSEKISNIISTKKYQFLSQFSDSLTDTERELMRKYEADRIQVNEDYLKKVRQPKKEQEYSKINFDWLRIQFKKTWEENEQRKLIVSDEKKPFYKAICLYFSKHDDFNKTTVTENIPSLEKGLLIIGKNGCGKTTMMNAYHEISKKLLPNKSMWFTSVSCNALVSEFESIEDRKTKEYFFKKYNQSNVVYFDDFGTENESSNYVKKNLLKDILEERYLKNKRTYLTTNLQLDEIHIKYGPRVFDRLQQMFNIIQMPGESLRK